MGEDFLNGAPAGGGYIGLLSFFSFAFSVIAAVLAIDLYALLRTSRSGDTWRVLIIASVMFALMHALRLAGLLRFDSRAIEHLTEIVELMFVMALAYAFYLQRKAFGHQRNTPAPPAIEPRPAIDAPLEEAALVEDAPPHALPDERPHAHVEAEDGHEDDTHEDDRSSEWARLNGQAEAPARRRGV